MKQPKLQSSIDHVNIKAEKVRNKKVTFISGLELFQIDYDELNTYLRNKCAA